MNGGPVMPNMLDTANTDAAEEGLRSIVPTPSVVGSVALTGVPRLSEDRPWFIPFDNAWGTPGTRLYWFRFAIPADATGG